MKKTEFKDELKEKKKKEADARRRSFPKPLLLPPVNVLVPSSESGPEAPVASNPRIGLRQQVKKEQIEQTENSRLRKTKPVEKKREDFKPQPVKSPEHRNGRASRDLSKNHR